MITIAWNNALINGVAIEEAFKETNLIMGVDFTKAISDNIWNWTDGANRDIVDTGRLRDSYNGRQKDPNTFEHIWATEYAVAVHEGAVLRSGGSTPARPWTRVTLANNDYADVFGRLARAKLGLP